MILYIQFKGPNRGAYKHSKQGRWLKSYFGGFSVWLFAQEKGRAWSDKQKVWMQA